MTPETTTGIDTGQLERFRGALRERISAGELKLPMLPKVAGRVMILTNDPDAGLGELADLIHKDQALAGHVLRAANSAVYARGQTIVSLQQAVARLGTRILAEITIAVSLRSETFRVPGFDGEIQLLWRHALASGGWGKEIARMKRRNVEGQFLCGLLHTVGKPIVLQALSELSRERSLDLDIDLARVLMDEFHSEVGAAVAVEWKLPQQVLITCLHYRNFNEAPTMLEECAMTHLADRLAHATLNPEEGEEEHITVAADDPVIPALNLYPDEVETLINKREKVLELVRAMEL